MSEKLNIGNIKLPNPELTLNIGKKGVFKKELIINPKVKVGATKYGYGLFASELIEKGEIIEECVITSDRISPTSSDLDNY